MRNDWEKLMKDKLDSASLDELLPGFELDAWPGVETMPEPVIVKKSSRRWITHVAAAVGGLLIGFAMFQLGGNNNNIPATANNAIVTKAVPELPKAELVVANAPVQQAQMVNVADGKHVRHLRNINDPEGTDVDIIDNPTVKEVQPELVPAINHGKPVHIADLDGSDDANKTIAATRVNNNTASGKVAAQMNRTGKPIHLMDMNEGYRQMAEKNYIGKPSQGAILNWATQELDKAASRGQNQDADAPLRNLFK